MEITPEEAAATPNAIVAEIQTLTPGALVATSGGTPSLVDSMGFAYGNVTLHLRDASGWEWDDTLESGTPLVVASLGDRDAFFEMRNKVACARQDETRLYAEYVAAHTPATTA